MMMRTQIYLPEEMHNSLLQLANQQSTTLSNLIRHGANLVLKKQVIKMSAGQRKALKFFSNPPKRYLINLKGKTAVQLIREERDDD